MLESGSPGRRDIDPGHKQEDSGEPHAERRGIKPSRQTAPMARGQGALWAKFTHVDAVQMAQLGRRSGVPAATLEGRGEGRCQGQGAVGERRPGARAGSGLTVAEVSVASGPRAGLRVSERLPRLPSLSPGWRRLQPLYN